MIRCGGQVFSGIARRTLLGILTERCIELGVNIEFERELTSPGELSEYDLVVAADGVRSTIRDAGAGSFRPRSEEGSSRYIWFGTDRVFDSFTVAFRSNADGLFQAHAYPYDGDRSTFIVECDEGAWRAAGLDAADEQQSISYCEEMFALDLGGRALVSNASKWIRFVTLKNKRWHHGNAVLLGDAAHTAHFSIGSGTKMAMEDSIALVQALGRRTDLPRALADYQLERKPRVERLQEAARQSQTFFESTRHYQHMEPLQFAFHLMARSGRIDYDDLRVSDAGFVSAVDRWFAGVESMIATPPAFHPVKLGSLEAPNRACVSAGLTYDASDGLPAPGSLRGLTSSGAGVLFSGPVAVAPEGRITRGCPGLYSDEHEEAWRSEVEATRRQSNSILAVTLNHSGPRGSTRSRHRFTDVALGPDEGWLPVAASEQTYSAASPTAATLDEAGLVQVLEAHRSATRRALAAGFDMVELNLAFGYLLASFLSPLTNRREDPYGGSWDNRARFPLLVFDTVREAWPRPLPAAVALSATDWARGGLRLADAVALAVALRDRGCDLIRVVAGQTVAASAPRYDPYFLTHYADRIRNEAGVATIATGDISSLDRVNTIVAAGQADLCLLRPG